MNSKGHPDARDKIKMKLKCYGMLSNLCNMPMVIFYLMRVAQALEITTIKLSSICLIHFQMHMYMNLFSIIKKVISKQ